MICLNVINSVENLLELEVLIFSELGCLTCTWLLYIYTYIYIYIKEELYLIVGLYFLILISDL